MAPIRDMLSATGLTEQQWRVLRVLDEGGAIDASALAERACLLLPSVSRITQAMADRGLIYIEKDTRDRRRLLICIADEGRALIQRNEARAVEIAAGFRAKLGTEAHDQLLALLELLAAPSNDI